MLKSGTFRGSKFLSVISERFIDVGAARCLGNRAVGLGAAAKEIEEKFFDRKMNSRKHSAKGAES
jgi:hypothetical protein